MYTADGIKSSVVYNVFGGHSDICDLAISILDRIDEVEDPQDCYEEVAQAMSDGLIYYDDEWTMLKYYFVPSEVDYNAAYEEFTNDLMSCVYNGAIVFLDEDEEDEEYEDEDEEYEDDDEEEDEE